MFLRVRRQLPGRGARWLLYPVLAVLLLAAVGGGYETVRESLDARAYPMPGQLDPCGWATAAPALHRLGQPDGRPRTRWRRVVLRLRVDCAGRGPRHHSLRLRPRRSRLERPSRRRPGRCPHRRGPAHPASTRPHSRRQRRPLRGRPSFAAEFPDQVAGIVLLDAPHPNPAQPSPPTPIPTTSSVTSPPYRPRPLTRSRTPAQPNLLHNSSATLPGRSPRQLLDRQPPCKLRRGVCSGSTRRCRRPRPCTDLHAKPLIVLTADEGAPDDQWQSKQDHLAGYCSTNSLHRHANATHDLLPDKRPSRRRRRQPGNPRRRHRRAHWPPARPALGRSALPRGCHAPLRAQKPRSLR